MMRHPVGMYLWKKLKSNKLGVLSFMIGSLKWF